MKVFFSQCTDQYEVCVWAVKIFHKSHFSWFRNALTGRILGSRIIVAMCLRPGHQLVNRTNFSILKYSHFCTTCISHTIQFSHHVYVKYVSAVRIRHWCLYMNRADHCTRSWASAIMWSHAQQTSSHLPWHIVDMLIYHSILHQSIC